MKTSALELSPLPVVKSSRKASDLQLMAGLANVCEVLRVSRISLGFVHALAVLAARRGEQITLTLLAGEIGVSTAAVTNIVDRLEAQGMATRVAESSDRRLIFIVITDMGLEFSRWIQASLRVSAKLPCPILP